ncbi:hypothetical protein, partial [Staphylococcus shinii]|uniref:hypothetical protein n=1 Tax=Staphylococcus shinii TaxID=2912228 RepID=UPI003F5195C6
MLEAALSERTALRTFTPIRSQPGEGDQLRWMDRVEIDGEARTALFMHPVARQTYRVPATAPGWFVAWVGLVPDV